MHKFNFYAPAIFQHLFVPELFFRMKSRVGLNQFSDHEILGMADRANHYNKLSKQFRCSDEASTLREMVFTKRSACYYDTRRIIRCFPSCCKYFYDFRDITHTPSIPTIVKSRPITDNNTNSILLKLNSVRNYFPISDKLHFEDKIPMLVWRGQVNRNWRKKFIEKHWQNKKFNIGHTNPNTKLLPKELSRKFMSLDEQLQYRYILSLEGNNYASNLKWISQSNSLCFMPRPKHETWFMESTLIPDYHYIEVDKEYSNIEGKMDYYNAHPEEAKEIIKNFQTFYKNTVKEPDDFYVSFLVILKYLKMSSQINIGEFLNNRISQFII